jgi:hypothetical protein
MLRDVNWEPLTFCMQRYMCKKHKTNVKGHQSGAPCFFIRIGSLMVRAIGSESLALIRNTYC